MQPTRVARTWEVTSQRAGCEGTVVVCPRHGSRFDLRDGTVIRWTDYSGLGLRLVKAVRSPRPLRTYPVLVQDGRLLVDVEPDGPA